MPHSVVRRAWRPMLLLLALCASVLALPTVAGAAPGETISRHDMKTMFQTQNGASQGSQTGHGPPKPQTNGISYHGGPVILGPTKAYIIWYGNFSTSSRTILTNLLQGIGGSPYFNINTTYYNGSATHVTNAVTFVKAIDDNYSQGRSLSDSAVRTVVANAVSSTALPSDPNGLYFVLTSADVAETSGFLTQYCGWHAHGTFGSADLKYSFVGDPSRNLAACSAQTTSPNGNTPADAMASVMAHELEETTTDPDLNAWYDSRGYENADKCAWTFGTTSTLSSGAKYNMTLGTTKYLIQRNWVNASGGFCALSY